MMSTTRKKAMSIGQSEKSKQKEDKEVAKDFEDSTTTLPRDRLKRQEPLEEAHGYVALDARHTKDEPGAILMYFNSGCNTACHGELWVRKHQLITGEAPRWIHQEGKKMTGAGTKDVQHGYQDRGWTQVWWRDWVHEDCWKQCTDASISDVSMP